MQHYEKNPNNFVAWHFSIIMIPFSKVNIGLER